MNYIQLVKENYTFKELNDNKINETVTRIKYKDFIIKEQRLISLSDLFGCYNGKLTSLDQIKGIYYSYGKFYLILKQIYFVYEVDLVEERFDLINKEQKIGTFIFENENELHQLKIAMEDTKWIKTIGKNSYIVFFEDAFEFDIDLASDDLKIKKMNDLKFTNCESSTFEIKGKNFCFRDQIYNQFILKKIISF